MKLKAVVCIMASMMLVSSAAWAGLTKTEVSQLYVSVFNRASEGEGNAYWKSQPDMATAAAAMLDTDAARNYFGANLNTNQAFIAHIYLNTLNKTIADDSEGIDYWVGLLDAGTARGNVVAALVGVIKDYAPGGPYYNPGDAATVAAYNRFTNRVTVSDYMADTVYNTPEDWETATAFDSGLVVTDDQSTVVAAKAVVDGFNGEDSSPPSVNEYSMPIKVGNYVRYKVTSGNTVFYTKSEITEAGDRYYIAKNTSTLSDGYSLIKYVLQNGIWKMASMNSYHNGSLSGSFVYSPYPSLLPSKIESGYSEFQQYSRQYTYYGSKTTTTVKETFHVECFERITVPAGVFDAVKINSRTKSTTSLNAGETESDSWYAKGIGLIKFFPEQEIYYLAELDNFSFR